MAISGACITCHLFGSDQEKEMASEASLQK
jgi:hypothetical protein